MNLETVEKIANAVLYEGYMLYPYRASSVKNRQRFNWGVLAPQSYSEAQRGTENWQMQTECLVLAAENTESTVKVRFLHLRERQVYQSEPGELRPVQSLEIDGQIFQTWQEAVEREANIALKNLNKLLERPEQVEFTFPASEERESLADANGDEVGIIVRRQELITGKIEVHGSLLKEGEKLLFKLTARVLNLTPFAEPEQKDRDQALAQSFVSTHAILSVCGSGAEFVSLLEPPPEFAGFAGSCQNLGVYPVLTGENGARETMLASPIILYDYPQIAPESHGDLFDGAEIDEILTLRIMTMTDDEKREMRGVDERARKMLERTETISDKELMSLHGALRK